MEKKRKPFMKDRVVWFFYESSQGAVIKLSNNFAYIYVVFASL